MNDFEMIDGNGARRTAVMRMLVAALCLWPAAAFAHVESGSAGGFGSGLWHPVSGWDHVLAMVAVGIWGAQLGKPAVWVLPVAFPMMMAFGGMLGLIGVPIPGVEIRLREPFEGSGEVEVRGPNVFGGYWHDAEATSAAFDGEWFRTGDLGRFDDDGFLRLVGRAKEIIVTGGYNVSPLAVERALEECRGVVELAVAAVPDSDLGERVTAFVVARTGMALDELEARLRARAEAELPRYAWPREYRFCESLPRNALGKVERARLGDRQILRD